MKIIHTGDIHIGSAMKGLPPEKARLRKTEILSDFRRLCAYAKSENAGAVLIAGDLFDGNRVAGQFVNETLAAISSAAPVPFFYVSGNHDDEVFFSETPPENLHTFSDARGFKSFDLSENVTVTGMDTKYFSSENFAALCLRRERFNLVLLHGDIRSEIPIERLREKYIDYLALGHIHKPDLQAITLDGRGKYRYCGCMEGRGFDETGRRGFFLLETEKGRLRSEKFLSFAKRSVEETFVDVSACKTYFDVENAAGNALKNVSRENIVKIILCGRHSAGLRKDVSLLTARFSGEFFFVKTEDRSRPYIDYNAYREDITERGEFVREAGRYEMNEDFRAEVLEVGLQALAGEEIDL